MVHTSDVINEYSAAEKKWDSKLSKLCSAFISSLSLSWVDTAFSTLKTIAENIIEKCVQDAKWNQQIEQCIRAVDTAAMSQDQICSLLEIITEILNSSEIDIQQFILDAKYIDKLASDLAGNDSSNETDRLSRVLANVFHLFSDTLYRMPEFNKVMADIIRDHDRALKEHKEVLDDHEERIQRMEYEPHDVEEFLESLPSLRLSKKSRPFAYDYFKLQDIWGRDVQIEKLCSFAEDDSHRFQFCVITGPAGIGKSKLVFHFSRIYQQKKDWLVRNLNQKPLQGLCEKKNWTTEKNILLIIDYANEQELLTDLLSKLSRLKEEGYWRKIRLILIAREGTSPSIYNSHQKDFPKWYMDIVHDDWAINDHLFLNEFIDLCGLTIEDCTSLHIAYATNYLKRNITLKDESNIKQLIEQEVLDEDGLARPLYALFVIDLYYRNSDVRSWDLESLQEQIYLRDWVKWKTEICGKRNKRENVFIALTNLLLYATIFNKWESSVTLPEPLDKDCKIVFNAANAYATDYKSKWFKILTGKNVFFNGESVLVRLTPDMVGEYYALKRLSSFDKSTLHSWATLMTAQLVDCREFFIRAIQDFGNNKTFIVIFLKIFRVMSELIAKDDNDTHKAFASILETFFRNYKGNEDDRIFQNISDVINQYIEDNKNNCAYAAELTLLFHENRPHIGSDRRVEHFECIEPLYNRWPESRKIASAYISFLGDIAASSIGAHAPAYSDSYITKFEKLLNLAKSTDYVIKKAFIPVLIKAIERANSVHDWKRSTFLEDFFLKEVMEQCGDELALDCISKFDSVIISLTKQRADLVQAVTSEPISESKQLTIQEIDQKLEKEIVFFRHVINSNSNPSVNFVWTYVGKLSMVTKNLFIHECMPHNELLFQYMLRKLQEVYTMHYNSNTSSILAWRASRALDEFCDAKSEAIPPFIRVQCILNKPN